MFITPIAVFGHDTRNYSVQKSGLTYIVAISDDPSSVVYNESENTLIVTYNSLPRGDSIKIDVPRVLIGVDDQTVNTIKAEINETPMKVDDSISSNFNIAGAAKHLYMPKILYKPDVPYTVKFYYSPITTKVVEPQLTQTPQTDSLLVAPALALISGMSITTVIILYSKRTNNRSSRNVGDNTRGLESNTTTPILRDRIKDFERNMKE